MAVTLKFVKPFGPFHQMPEVSLPNFAVLTGMSGSGKTQLLRAIADGRVEAWISGNQVDPKQILYVGPQLSPKLQLEYRGVDALREERAYVHALQKYKTSVDRQHRPIAESPIEVPASQVRLASTHLERLARLLDKSRLALLTEEAEAFAVSLAAEDTTEHFSTHLAHVSMGHLRKYYHRFRAMAAQQIRDKSLDKLIETIGDLQTKPPPWELVSQVLKPFGFRIEGPEVSIKSAQKSLELKLRNSTGKEVPPEQLSGGEQSLLALAIAQYATLSSSGFAKLLLLDESLSSLHPSIIKLALATIRDVFVEKNGIHVILVTHAATLVALAPPDSTYQVWSHGSRLHLNPASIDVGIGLLTTGIPTMRVDPRNRRQVLVEANHDEFLYQRAYQALRPRLKPEVSLEFLSCGRQEGSSSKVLDLVKRLRDAGISTVCGIVDWDGGENDTPPDGVYVLAKNDRYAIENVFLDPLLLAFVLARNETGRAVIGVTSGRELDSLKEDGLQTVTDKIVAQIATKRPSGRVYDECLVDVAYVGNRCLKHPSWVLKMRGHDFAECVTAAFPVLKQYRSGPNNSAEDRLVGSIVADHLVDALDFIPLPLLSLFQQLQDELNSPSPS